MIHISFHPTIGCSCQKAWKESRLCQPGIYCFVLRIFPKVSGGRIESNGIWGNVRWLYCPKGFYDIGRMPKITTNWLKHHCIVSLCRKEGVHVDLFYISRKISHDVASGLYRGRKGDIYGLSQVKPNNLIIKNINEIR